MGLFDGFSFESDGKTIHGSKLKRDMARTSAKLQRATNKNQNIKRNIGRNGYDSRPGANNPRNSRGPRK